MFPSWYGTIHSNLEAFVSSTDIYDIINIAC